MTNSRSERESRKIGLSLSGGGSRAIAFHLGGLKALNEAGILARVDVISAVSGGSVIAAMYAYSDDPFDKFEARVKELLQNGLQGGILRHWLSPATLAGAVGTAVIAGSTARMAEVFEILLSSCYRLLTGNSKTPHWIDGIHPPFRRWVNRTTAFESYLRKKLFPGLKIDSRRRNDADVVINACELRTGTAFRFGSQASSCWRFGSVEGNDVDVATAVAASAAYPALLPCLDRVWHFRDKAGKDFKERVFLTDGGVYDNLGISCFRPGRSADVTYNVFHPDYIICCNAGHGQFDKESYPYWWGPRMTRSVLAIMRKVQDNAMELLFQYEGRKSIKGFVLSYLGQFDNTLPEVPPDLVTREQVVGYPTDFAPMSAGDIELISTRGRQLTKLLLEHSCRELIP